MSYVPGDDNQLTTHRRGCNFTIGSANTSYRSWKGVEDGACAVVEFQNVVGTEVQNELQEKLITEGACPATLFPSNQLERALQHFRYGNDAHPLGVWRYFSKTTFKSGWR